MPSSVVVSRRLHHLERAVNRYLVSLTALTVRLDSYLVRVRAHVMMTFGDGGGRAPHSV